VNIAEGRPTFRKAQYNQYFGSEKAVDVNPGSSYRSLDETNQWWRVELDDTVYVRILAIRNEDCEYNIIFNNLQRSLLVYDINRIIESELLILFLRQIS